MTAVTAQTYVQKPIPSALRLALLHAKFHIVEQIRVPIAVIGNAVFPSLAMLAFVVPQSFAQIPEAATAAATQLMYFFMMSTSLFTFGLNIAEDRAQPWDSFVRTLPVTVGPRMVGRLLGSIPFFIMGIGPLLIIAATMTAASVTWTQAILGLFAVSLGTVPFLLGGYAIGYLLPSKAALAVVQLVLFPMAFLGGLFLPPASFAGWINTISLFLPSRAGRDIAVAATSNGSVTGISVLCIAVWIVALLALALWGYGRDERRRFS